MGGAGRRAGFSRGATGCRWIGARHGRLTLGGCWKNGEGVGTVGVGAIGCGQWVGLATAVVLVGSRLVRSHP